MPCSPHGRLSRWHPRAERSCTATTGRQLALAAWAIDGVVDWEEPRVGDPTRDVAICRGDLTLLFGQHGADAFLRHYEAAGHRVSNLPFWDLLTCTLALSEVEHWPPGWRALGRSDLTVDTARASSRSGARRARTRRLNVRSLVRRALLLRRRQGRQRFAFGDRHPFRLFVLTHRHTHKVPAVNTGWAVQSDRLAHGIERFRLCPKPPHVARGFWSDDGVAIGCLAWSLGHTYRYQL
jgi:hypothetical protein